jgi:hypothetical protein
MATSNQCHLCNKIAPLLGHQAQGWLQPRSFSFSAREKLLASFLLQRRPWLSTVCQQCLLQHLKEPVLGVTIFHQTPHKICFHNKGALHLGSSGGAYHYWLHNEHSQSSIHGIWPAQEEDGVSCHTGTHTSGRNSFVITVQCLRAIYPYSIPISKVISLIL